MSGYARVSVLVPNGTDTSDKVLAEAGGLATLDADGQVPLDQLGNVGASGWNFVHLTTPIAGNTYQASADDYVIVTDSADAGPSIYLPQVSLAGKNAQVGVMFVSGFAVHVYPNAADSGVTISGFVSLIGFVDGPSGVILLCDGSNWWCTAASKTLSGGQF